MATIATNFATDSKLHIKHLPLENRQAKFSITGPRDGERPFADRRHPRAHRIQPRERECCILGSPGTAGEVDGKHRVIGKRLQQANHITGDGNAGTDRRHGCRDLHRRTVVDAIGNRIAVAAARDGGSRERQFGPPARHRIDSFTDESTESDVVAVAMGE